MAKRNQQRMTPDFLRGAVAMFLAIDASDRDTDPAAGPGMIELEHLPRIAEATGIPVLALRRLLRTGDLEEWERWRMWPEAATFRRIVAEVED